MSDQMDDSAGGNRIDDGPQVGYQVLEPVGGGPLRRAGMAGSPYVVRGDQIVLSEQLGYRCPHKGGVGVAVNQQDCRAASLAPLVHRQRQPVASDGEGARSPRRSRAGDRAGRRATDTLGCRSAHRAVCAVQYEGHLILESLRGGKEVQRRV